MAHRELTEEERAEMDACLAAEKMAFSAWSPFLPSLRRGVEAGFRRGLEYAERVVPVSSEPEHNGIPDSYWREVPCGHPADPVALRNADGTAVCHCGRGLALVGDIGLDIEGAPGPVFHCDKCGCHVAVPPLPVSPVVEASGEKTELLIEELREAVAFLRSCELSGESGADHPRVLDALEASKPRRRAATPRDLQVTPDLGVEASDDGEHDGPCQRCGQPCVAGLGGDTYWFADNELWNEVVPGRVAIYCPACFTGLCREARIAIGWRAGRVGEIEPAATRVPEEAQTDDGRDRQVRGAGSVIRRGSSLTSDRGEFVTGPPSSASRVSDDAQQEIERLRNGLFKCAEAAGEDVSDGIPGWPDVVEWAVRAVAECRDESESDGASRVSSAPDDRGLREAAQEALLALAALKGGDVPERHAPEVWVQMMKAHDLLLAALTATSSSSAPECQRCGGKGTYRKDGPHHEEFDSHAICPDCSPSSSAPESPCEECNGLGTIKVAAFSNPDEPGPAAPCPRCGGSAIAGPAPWSTSAPEQVERASRAAYEEGLGRKMNVGGPWYELEEWQREHWRGLVRAVLDAVPSPPSPAVLRDALIIARRRVAEVNAAGSDSSRRTLALLAVREIDEALSLPSPPESDEQ